jgi:hypothetical protein
MKMHRSLRALVLFGICNTAFAQWQWLDRQGHQVFSDRAPPAEVSEKHILKRPNGPSSTPPTIAESTASEPDPAPLSGLDKELQARRQQTDQTEAAKRRSEVERMAKARVENCARAKQSQVTLDSGVRISRTNAAGEREILDDAARAAERARIQALMGSECK